MSKYASIDNTLAEWAKLHSITWLTDYKDTEVRTFFLGSPTSRSRVQVWVDPPVADAVIVHVFRGGGYRTTRNAQLVTTSSKLSKTLSEALAVATGWTR